MRTLLFGLLAAAAVLGADAHKHHGKKHDKHGKKHDSFRVGGFKGHKDHHHGHHDHHDSKKAFDLADYPCTDLASCLHSWHKLEHRMPALKSLRKTLLGEDSEGEHRHVWDLVPGAKEAWKAVKHGETPGQMASLLASAPVLTGTEYCKNNSYFELFPQPVGVIPADGNSAPTATWSQTAGFCFSSVTATADVSTGNAKVTLTGTGASGLLCSDTYLVTSSMSIQLVSISALGPSASVTLNFTGADEAFDVKMNGVQVMVLPCGLLGTISSAIKTVSLFNGANIAQNNIAFLAERGTWPQNPPQPFNKTTAVDKTAIRSGDYLAIIRFDGLDPMIAFGTGGTTGHSALAVWRTDSSGNRDLYVVESTDKNPLGPVYFPPPYGITIHQFDQWIGYAQNAQYNVALLPLAADIAAAFDETAFWTFFDGVFGMPYGYHTMLLSFLDTWNPFANLPMPINTGRELAVIMNVLDPILGNSTSGVTVSSMFTWPLNKRLNTTCANLRCIINTLNQNKAAGKSPASFGEAVAIPEQDGVKYGGNYSMVCSEFAAMGLKVGLQKTFPIWSSIQAAEQTPKDNYQMAIYDTTGSRFNQQTCPGGVTTVAGGNGSYCQLMGPYQQILNGYNTVSLYANMNNQCACQWPAYVRGPAGC
jgi:hypothetical protein